MITDINKPYKYTWEEDIVPYLDTMTSVEGGYTPAKRGIATLKDGTKVFVKIATGPMTEKWLKKEIKTYLKLNEAGYGYIPLLLAHNDEDTAMAIEYLEGHSFENVWDKKKVDAVMHARQALKQYKEDFVGDKDFASGDVVDFDLKWPYLLKHGNLDKVNTKLHKLGRTVQFTAEQIQDYQKQHQDWSMSEDTLVHEDVRADNFGYNSETGEGKLIDWNWLCIGDESLDTTPLFISMYRSGFDPYKDYPEKYDPQMLLYLVGFWLASILDGDEDSSDREWSLRQVQAENIELCMELLTKQP